MNKRPEWVTTWNLIVKILGLLLLIVGLFGAIDGPFAYPLIIPKWLADFHQKMSGELVGIGLTVLIIDTANDLRSRDEEKKSLILQMGSDNNALARQAVRKLWAHGWIESGVLRRADLTEADLDQADLRRANLEGATLHRAELTEANLTEANLKDTDLRLAEMRNTQLIRANLQGADLDNADLQEADLTGADLRDTDLNNTTLINVDLRNAFLQKADLRMANLQGAKLAGATLTGAKVTNKQLAEVESLTDTIMPDGQKYDPAIHKLEVLSKLSKIGVTPFINGDNSSSEYLAKGYEE